MAAIIGQATYGTQGEFWSDREIFHVSTGWASWAEFWESTLRGPCPGSEDLPDLEGAPDAVVLLGNDGNDFFTLGQAGTTFYFVHYGTS